MTPAPLRHAVPDDITEAAAQWCMRVHAEDLSAQEHAAFAQWLAADPLHASEYQAMAEIWGISKHLAPSTPAPTAVKSKPKPWRRYAKAVVFALLALPAAGWFGWTQNWIPDAYQRFDSTDIRRQVVLGDGTQVELNLNSRLTYANFRSERRVTLNAGEAFFDVTHDSEHPFVVNAAQGRITVTGTRFNVWMYQDQVKVVLVAGSVLVRSADDTNGYRLEPGMQAVYGKGDHEPQLSQVYASDNSLAWRSDRLVLDNQPLAQALPQINRYLEQPLVLADRETGEVRIGGVFNTAEVKRLVSNLPKVLPVYLTRSKNGDTVINRISPRPKA